MSEQEATSLTHSDTGLVEGDILLVGNGFDRWFTHVQFDQEMQRWHREADYTAGVKVGNIIQNPHVAFNL